MPPFVQTETAVIIFSGDNRFILTRYTIFSLPIHAFEFIFYVIRIFVSKVSFSHAPLCLVIEAINCDRSHLEIPNFITTDRIEVPIKDREH
jgi:hypothetical protein